MSDAAYLEIVHHYERCLQHHRDGARAVDWKSDADAVVRYDVMLGIVRDPSRPATLLDFGCGLAALKQHMMRRGIPSAITYMGLEISPLFAEAARNAVPGAEIVCLDVLEEPDRLPQHDYVVMNGIFTRRSSLSIGSMEAYTERLLGAVYAKCRVGLAFNVMSKAVDWESDVLFHPDPGWLLAMIGRGFTRNYVLRNDYGLHETTIYLYREPAHGARPGT